MVERGEATTARAMNRRTFLGMAALGAASGLLAACAPAPAPSPTAAPAKPGAEPTKPAAAPAATTAPAASKPAAGPANLPPLADADKGYKVTVYAGGVGWDHGMPYMAKGLDLWSKRYELDVDFKFGNPVISAQVISTGQFDVTYNHNLQTLQFAARGAPARITAATSAGSAFVLANEKVSDPKQLEGTRYGVITKGDGMDILYRRHILPSHNVDPSKMEAVQVPFDQAAVTLQRGDIMSYFLWEPAANQQQDKPGVKILWDWQSTWNNGIFFRNCMVMNANLIKDHPAIAKRLVWAHLDGLNFIRQNREQATDIMFQMAEGKTDRKWFEVSYEDTDWSHDKLPDQWIALVEKDLIELDLVAPGFKAMSYIDWGLQEGYTYVPPTA
jgi:ABC-type nitrate/sulfonate/bicarbonate transport system substrate-binding protein